MTETYVGMIVGASIVLAGFVAGYLVSWLHSREDR